LRNIHDQARAASLLQDRPAVDLRLVKDLLNEFANERAKLPHAQRLAAISPVLVPRHFPATSKPEES